MASFEQSQTSKLWSVRFRVIEFGVYKNKRLPGFKTKKEADKAYSEYVSTHHSSIKLNNSKILFYELFLNYIEVIKNRVKPSSLYDIKCIFNTHILPYFRNLPIVKIQKTDVFSWQEKLTEQGYSYKYKAKIRNYLGNIFKYAIFYYDLPLNPVYQVEPFKRVVPTKEMEIWSVEEFKTFINSVDNFLYSTFFNFLYLTGCRKGEAFALTWDKIDFESNKVLIDCSLTRKSENKAYEILTTKTGVARKIVVPVFLIALLKKLKEETNGNFVFGGVKPLSENTVTRKFNYYIKKAEVKRIHIHCLRHSHASLLILEGNSIVLVSKRLGHSTIEQTLNTYSHLMPSEENKLVDTLEKLF